MDILKQIQNYKPYNSQEKKDKEVFLRYIRSFDNYLTRDNEYGHMCSSVFVLNKERTKVIMTHHNIFNSWGWMGGHVDGDSDFLNVAIKEAREESGLKNIVPISQGILTLDTLPVGGHTKKGKYVPAHVHLSLSFLLEGDERETLRVREDENSGVKWVPIEKMVELSNEPFMQYVYEKAIKKMRDSNYIK